MLKDRSKNLIAVVNGLKMSVHATVARSIFEMLKESQMVPPPAVDAAEGLVSLTTDNTIRYRASLKEKTSIPSLRHEMTKLAKNFKDGTPEEIRKKIKPVMEASKGITKMELRGLPYHWEMDVAFENFAPFTLMQKLLDM